VADPDRAFFESVVRLLGLDELLFGGGCTTGRFRADSADYHRRDGFSRKRVTSRVPGGAVGCTQRSSAAGLLERKNYGGVMRLLVPPGVH
jgi:hypothetical protein